MPSLRAPDLIAKKRDGCSLTDEELEQFVQGVVNGNVTDAQTGAMLMAIYLRGLDDGETATLTSSMLESGDVLQWPAAWKGQIVDKHSTGGVGEKTSLVLAPVLAACGLKVPMISGRGLGHTGGTLDKLEAIPGFRASISMQEMQAQLAEVGAFIVGPTKEMVPADKVLYATRDITSTVANKSLIAASIMSKKLAESLDALVIQLTYGSAAFMKTEQDARALSRILIDIGRRKGIKVSCMLMTMDDPLGRTVGNALEVREAVQCLNGQGPKDLMDVVCQLAAQLLVSCGQVDSADRGRQVVDQVIQDGSARRKFIDMAVAQGADRGLAERMFDKDGHDILPKASRVTNISADETGFVQRIDAMSFGTLCHQLGAGRTKPTDHIDMGVGAELCVTVGDYVNKGDPWVKVHHEAALTVEQVTLIKSSLTLGPDLPPDHRLTRVTDVLH